MSAVSRDSSKNAVVAYVAVDADWEASVTGSSALLITALSRFLLLQSAKEVVVLPAFLSPSPINITEMPVEEYCSYRGEVI